MPKILSAILLGLVGLILPILSPAKTLPLTPPPAMWAKVIDSKVNFHQVTPQLYRSEQLLASDLPLLKANGIDTIINLRYFDRDEDSERLANQGLTLKNYPLLTWAIKPEQLAQVLVAIDNERAQGKTILVHCYHGADRTGVVIAMYRIIKQGWTIEQAKAEMMQGGYGYHSIWKNIEQLLTQKKVDEVKLAYQRLKKASL